MDLYGPAGAHGGAGLERLAAVRGVANRAPTKIVVKRQDQNYVIKLKREGRAGGGKPRVATP